MLRKLSAAQPYAGTADPPGYADLAAGAGRIASGNLLHSYGKSQFFMGKSTISMVHFQ